MSGEGLKGQIGGAQGAPDSAVPARRVLILPGLNGHPGLLMRATPTLFPRWRALAFNHHVDTASDGIDGLTERALKVLDEDAAGDEPAFVCGESFGGTIALGLARRYPERVCGLILFSAFGWHPSNLARRGVAALAVWSFLGHRVSTPIYRVGRMASLPTQLGLRVPRELLHEYISRPRAHVAAYRAKAELSLTFDARPWLAEVTAPTFILVGSWDPVVPPSAGRELAAKLPDAHLVRLSGGHLVHLIHARRVGQLVEAWARRLQ